MLFEVMGHLKPGVTPAQATADLDSIGCVPREELSQRRRPDDFSLARPGLAGDLLGGPMKGFWPD